MNPYCEALGIDVPRLEDVASHREARTYARLIVALLERGGPMTLAQVADRFEQAGLGSAPRALLSLKRCKPGRPPVYRTGDEYALDPHSDEAGRWAFRLELRPPHVPLDRPDPEPVPGPDQPLSVSELDEAWKGASLFSGWSAQRIVVAVLEVCGRPMSPEEVVTFVDERTDVHALRSTQHQFGRQRCAVQIDEDGRWRLVPGHDAIHGARKAVRDRLEILRRRAAQWGTPESWEADRRAAEARRAARAARLALLRRKIIHAFPASAPETVVVVDVEERRITTLSVGDPALRGLLDEAGVIAALAVRSLLQALAYEPGARPLHELGPPQKTRQLDRRGRTLSITTDLLVRGSCNISRPFGDPKVLNRYRRQGQDTRLRRRLEADAKALYAMYEYGRLHGALRLRWGFLDEWIRAPWVDLDEPKLGNLLGEALDRGVPLDIVAGNAPGWADPWSRARRCVVRAGPDRWSRWLIDEYGQVIDEAEVQKARLVTDPDQQPSTRSPSTAV